MLLLVHGEVTAHDVDIFDREKEFLDTALAPIVRASLTPADRSKSTSRLQMQATFVKN